MEVLNAKLRTATGKEVCKKMKLEGRVPGVVYGRGNTPFNVEVSFNDLKRLIKDEGESSLIELKVASGEGEKSYKVFYKEIQYHPLGKGVEHIDFQIVEEGVPFKARVPIRLVGNPVGVVEKGGNLHQRIGTLHIKVSPEHYPKVLEIDVSRMDVGQTLYVRDLDFGEHIRILNPPDLGIASIEGGIREALETGEGEEGESSEAGAEETTESASSSE